MLNWLTRAFSPAPYAADFYLKETGAHSYGSTIRRPVAPFCPWPNAWFTNGNSPTKSETNLNTMPPPAGTPKVAPVEPKFVAPHAGAWI